MDSTKTGQSLQCMEVLQRAIPSLLAGGDFLPNLRASLQIIGNAFHWNRLFFISSDTSDPRATVMLEQLAIERHGEAWNDLPEEGADPQSLYTLKAPVLALLKANETVAGSFAELFAGNEPVWHQDAAGQFSLIPLFSGDAFRAVLGIGQPHEREPLQDEEQMLLDTYLQSLVSWLDRYELFRTVRRERDQLRDLINFGEPLAVKEAILKPNWAHSITDAQLLNRKITTTIPDQIFIIDLHDYSNLFSNRATFLGYDLASIDNPFEFFQQLIHPDDLGPAFEEFFEKLMQATDDEIIESEYRMFTKAGEVVWFNERVKVFKRDSEGQVWQYLNVLQDITSRKLALEAEAELQHRYKNFITYSSDGIYYMSCGEPIDIALPLETQQELYYKNAYIKDANPAIAQMYGLQSVDELIGRMAIELHQGEHLEENQQSFTELVKNGFRIENIETAEMTPEGKLKYFLNHAVGSINNGKLEGIWGTQQDITAKKEAELARRESDMLFRSLYEKNPLGIVVGDALGNILHYNDRFAEMLDYGKDELSGKNFQAITHPDDVEDELRKIRREAGLRKSLMFLEKRYLTKQGQIIWANLHMSLLYTDDGRLRLAIGMVEDVTDKRKIHLALEKNEIFQKAILTTLPDLKFRISMGGYFLDYYPSPNDEAELLTQPENFLGRPISEILPGYIAEAVKRNIELAIKTGQLREFEYVLPLRGQLNHYEIRISAINQEEVIAVIRNVSERNWAQIELQGKIRELDEKNKQLKDYIDSNMQLENFAYIASHDLREPLRTMSTFAQLLQKRYGHQLDESAHSYIDFVVKSAKDMNNLIEDLLTYSRIETQDNPKMRIDLPNLLEEITAGLKDTIEENEAVVELINIPGQVTANPYRLKQLFQNLIANAIKFRQTDVPPVVRVQGYDVGKQWQFEIRDNGIGIDPEFHSKIFLLFKKLHSRQEFQGTGLGLAICKKVVEQMGGDIWIDSEVGQGSTFSFTIRKEE